MRRRTQDISSALRRNASLLLAALCMSCDGGGLPTGLAESPEGEGPRIVWDLAARPLPEIPLPNDVATWPDPSSPTGLRINASFIAPTQLESDLRETFGTLDGWGAYMPITIPFDAPIDPESLLSVQGGELFSASDFQRHAVYLVDMETGLPVPLDVNGGNFHYGLARTGRYYPNDPAALEANILFESRDEDLDGDGVLDPGEDTDFDGVLDRPNTRSGRAGATPEATYDDMLWFYERETNTLFLRPIIPLRERHRYAVVVTDRVRGADGNPVRSPFGAPHHLSQRDELEPLMGLLRDHRDIYGSLGSREWNGIAFAWTFTTQSTTSELFELREGLYGRGRFAFLADQFPPDMLAAPARGGGRGAGCADPGSQLVIATFEQLEPVLSQLAEMAFGIEGEGLEDLLATFDNVAHFVVGFVEAPYLLGDPREPRADSHFDLDALERDRNPGRDLIPVIIAIPEASETQHQPFPVAIYGHGHTSANLEGLAFAGMLARNGIASVAIDSEGHGLGLDSGLRTIVESLFAAECLGPMGRALSIDRAVDLDGDGVPDSGGNFWSFNIFHTRDVVRQTALDWIQVIRVLRHFGIEAPRGPRAAVAGTLTPPSPPELQVPIDFDSDGLPDMAGDFDGDGVPDLGGWNAGYHGWGQSLGGFIAPIVAGVEPAMRTAAPVSGAAGLLDVGVRSQISQVQHATALRAFGPLVIGEPAPSEGSFCSEGERRLALVVSSVTSRVDVEFACLPAARLDEGDVVVVRNLRNRETRCGGVGVGGTFRVPIPTDTGDGLVVEIYRGRLLEFEYGERCQLREGPMPAPDQTISTFEIGSGTSPESCRDCPRYQRTTWVPGDLLVAPTEGFGLRRQSPEYRRFFALAQMGAEPGDPVSYVRRIFQEPFATPDRREPGLRSLLVTSSVGDQDVPLSAGNAMARAAGILAFLPPDAPEGLAEWRAPAEFGASRPEGVLTPNALLNEYNVLEGLTRFERHPVAGAAFFLADVDDLSRGRQLFTEAGRVGGTLSPVRAVPPLRWTRESLPVAIGGRFAPARGTFDAISGVLNLYVVPGGNHGAEIPDRQKTWDESSYFYHLIGRYFVTDGRELRYYTHPGDHLCLEDGSCEFLTR